MPIPRIKLSYFFKAAQVLFFLALLPQAVQAQDEVDKGPELSLKNGISLTQDSTFQLNLRFRMQNRLGYTSFAGDDLSGGVVDARVRRMRLRFDGFVLNSKLRYYVQLSFSKADLDLESGSVAQPLRDAMVSYHFSKNFHIGFGQGKLPSNRQRMGSSGNLQFADRSIASGLYGLDRDFGIFANWSIPAGSQEFRLKGALTTGDGRGASPSSSGMAYTGRFEWLPLGTFTNSGDFSEGDLEFETTPKLSFGAVYSHNEQAYRSGGQTGLLLYAPLDINTFIADALLKYRGWALSTEYFRRSSPDAPNLPEPGIFGTVQVGQGINTQLSKLFPSRYELAARYSLIAPETEMLRQLPYTEEVLLGSSKYLNGHRIKLQLYVGYRWLQQQAELDAVGSAWTTMFQVEFGI